MTGATALPETMLTSALESAVLSPREGGHAPPGAVIAIQVGTDSVTAAAGWADVRSGEPMVPETFHDLASVSKVLTTTCVLRLLDRGDLRLDTTVGAVLGGGGPVSDRTVGQLLEHRGGLRPWWPLHLDAEAAGRPLERLLELPPETAPDLTRTYSDLGFMLLGAIVARAVDTDFDPAVQELLLAPLRLDHVIVGGPRIPRASAAASGDGDAIERRMVAEGLPYPVPFSGADFPWRRDPIRGEIQDATAFHEFAAPAGHAGWFGTIHGMIRLSAALAADPDVHGLWHRETRDRMLQAGTDPSQALGYRRYPAGTLHPHRELFGHPGFTGSMVAFAPRSDAGPAYAVALATNRLHGDPAPTRTGLVPVDELMSGVLRRVVETDPRFSIDSKEN